MDYLYLKVWESSFIPNTVERIATAPRNRGAKRNAYAAHEFINVNLIEGY